MRRKEHDYLIIHEVEWKLLKVTWENKWRKWKNFSRWMFEEDRGGLKPTLKE